MRRGQLVDRPAPPTAPAPHAHLRALRAQGFDGAPEPHRITGDGREQLRFVSGEVALPPYPVRALTDTALQSVGALLSRLHRASAAVPVDRTADWPRELADPLGGPLLCHNDVCPENVVFRDGRAVALIDFDLAAPGRPLWDLAMAARYWIPMLDPVSAAHLGYPPGVALPRRLRLLADAYRLDRADRAQLPSVIRQATAAGRAFVARRVEAGDAVYRQAIAENGGWPRWDRLQAWQASQQQVFEQELLTGVDQDG